jgi:hypothetical protein
MFFLAALVLVAGMLGRPFLVMQQVGRFVDTLDQRPPEAIKAEMNYYVGLLGDFNPLVRRAAVTAMKAATRKDFGANSAVWADWWRANQDKWEYSPSQPSSPKPPIPAPTASAP